MLFPFSFKSKKMIFLDSKVNDAAKFLPTIHCHSPSPELLLKYHHKILLILLLFLQYRLIHLYLIQLF